MRASTNYEESRLHPAIGDPVPHHPCPASRFGVRKLDRLPRLERGKIVGHPEAAYAHVYQTASDLPFLQILERYPHRAIGLPPSFFAAVPVVPSLYRVHAVAPVRSPS